MVRKKVPVSHPCRFQICQGSYIRARTNINRSLCLLASAWVLLIRPLRIHKPVHRSGRGPIARRVAVRHRAEHARRTDADTNTAHALRIPHQPHITGPATAAVVQPLHAAHAEPGAAWARRGPVAAASATAADDARRRDAAARRAERGAAWVRVWDAGRAPVSQCGGSISAINDSPLSSSPPVPPPLTPATLVPLDLHRLVVRNAPTTHARLLHICSDSFFFFFFFRCCVLFYC